MKRGRKKGGYSINDLDDKNDIINKIINQTNSLNKKIKSFQNEGITGHQEYLRNLITNDMVQWNDSGTISKSKKIYSDKHILLLKKTLSALHLMNNHDFYGTVNKYNKTVTRNIKDVKAYVEKYLKQKGYNDNFIIEVTNKKEFYVNLFSSFNEHIKSYGSDQLIEKIALNYEGSGFSGVEIDKILSNIEYSKNTIDRLNEEQKALEELRRNTPRR